MTSWLEPFFPYLPWHRCVWFDLAALGCIVALCDRSRWFCWRNADLLVLAVWVPLGEYELGPLAITTVLGWLPLFYLTLRLWWAVHRPPPRPSLPRAGITWLERAAVAGLLYAIGLSFLAPFPFGSVGTRRWCLSESGVVGALGAREMLSGRLPYGRSLSPEGTHRVYSIYGPAYFAVFMPATLVCGLDEPFTDYALAVRVTTVALLLVGFAGAHVVGALLAGREGSAALVFLWSVLSYVPQAAYWSWAGNLLPGVLTLWVLAALLARRWVLAGLALGTAAAAAFYPAVLLPLLAAAPPAGRDRWGLVLGFFCAVAAAFAPVALSVDGFQRLWLELSSYTIPGQMPEWRLQWSPWTYHPWAQRLKTTLEFLYLPLLGGLAWSVWTRPGAPSGRTWRAIVAGGAAVAGAQLFKLNAPGRMVLWTLPFLLVLLFPNEPGPTEDDAGTQGQRRLLESL